MAAGGRKSGRILIILALVLVVILAVVAVLMWDQLFPQQRQQPQTQQPLPTQQPLQKTVEIVVLTQPLALGATITESVLASISYPEEKFVPELFYLQEEIPDLIGKHVRYPLQPGIVLTRGLVSDESVGSFASSQIPVGYVAISIPITRLTSVSYALQPGDHVNVIVALLMADIDQDFQSQLPNQTGSVSITGGGSAEGGPVTNQLAVSITGGGPAQGRIEIEETINMPMYVLPSEPQRPRLVSQTLIQDAIILWVGEFDENQGAPETKPVVQPTPAEGQAAPTPPPPPDVVTLIVSPQDAVTLNYLMLAGARINLVLRSPEDTMKNPTEAVTLQFLMDQYTIPLPSKLPYGINPRIDYLVYPDTKERANPPASIP